MLSRGIKYNKNKIKCPKIYKGAFFYGNIFKILNKGKEVR